MVFMILLLVADADVWRSRLHPRVVNAQEQDALLGRIHAAFSASSVVTTRSATAGRLGTSQRESSVAAVAPSACAAINAGASAGRIPANVSDAARARVTAWLAKDADEVNQYAAVM